MTEYSKLNIIYKLQKWMDSVAGQTFLNYAYSWGAAIVILGTLFKLTYLPYANFFLYLGMGTEVFVFFLSAFDRPFDKTADGMELKHGKNIKVTRVSSSLESNNEIIELLNTRLAELEKINESLSYGEKTNDIHNIITAIHQVYQQQLIKLSSQLTSINKMDELYKIQSVYIGELNKIYAKMLEAMGGRTAILADIVKNDK